MKAHDGGFSLIEILVVIGAIGILLGIAIPAYYGYREKSMTARVMEELKMIETGIIALGTDTGKWPGLEDIGVEGSTEIEDLNSPEAGITNNDDDDFSNWNGPYLQEVPRDPWGTHYFFDPDYEIPKGNPNQVPVIGSYGPNGEGKNDYDSDDVILRLPCKSKTWACD